MKQLLLASLVLFSICAQAQITDGGKNHFHVTGGVMVVADSIPESDPTVIPEIKAITNTKINQWDLGYLAYTWGNPYAVFVAQSTPVNNPTFVNTLYFNKIVSFPGTSTQEIRGDGSTGTIYPYTAGTGITTTSGTITNTAPDQTVSITAGNETTVTGTYPNFTVAQPAKTFSTPSRALSNGSTNQFTPSSTRDTFASYTINIAYSLTLATSNGQVYLEYSMNSGSTWIIAGSVSNVFSLAVTLAGNNDFELSGFIPATALTRIRIVSNTNCTVTITSVQREVNM